jgi:hypothetical protein
VKVSSQRRGKSHTTGPAVFAGPVAFPGLTYMRRQLPECSLYGTQVLALTMLQARYLPQEKRSIGHDQAPFPKCIML